MVSVVERIQEGVVELFVVCLLEERRGVACGCDDDVIIKEVCFGQQAGLLTRRPERWPRC